MIRLPSQTTLLLLLIVCFMLLLPFSQPAKIPGEINNAAEPVTAAEIDIETGLQTGELENSTAIVTRPDTGPPDDGNRGPSDPGVIRVFGRVTDENQQPIAEVLVSDEYKFGSARTDGDGRYRISVENPRDKAPSLNFLRRGYSETRVGIPMDQLAGQAEFEIDLQLKRSQDSTSVDGWIGNQFGEGLSGYRVQIRARGGQGDDNRFYAVFSNAEGRFLFEGVKSGIDYQLKIEASDDYAGFSQDSFPVSAHTPETRIILERLERVNVDGMIVDTNNAPVADLSIKVQNLSIDYPDRRISSDSMGFFKLEGFPAGELKLSTNAPEYFEISGLSLKQDEYRNLNLSIDKGSYHLSGWVSDQNGASIEKAHVTLTSVFHANGYQSYSYRATSTDANGGFEFSGLGGQSHTLSIYAKGHPTRIRHHRFSSFSDSLQIRMGP